MRPLLAHLLPLPGGSVSGPDGRADRCEWDTMARGQLRDFGERDLEVLANVVAEGLERRDVDHFRFVRQFAGAGLADQPVQAEQKCGQCFAGASWRRDEHVAAGADFGPALDLRLRRAGKAGDEPLGD